MIIKNTLFILFFVLILMNIKSTFAEIYSYSFDGIDGKKINLSDFKSKPILIVNTASFCGYTYQYEKLQILHDRYVDKDLIIIAVPSNDFGSQEFKKNKDVKNFCETNFNVKFKLTSITPIRGKEGHPFFKWVKKQAGFLSFPKWNFYKYIIDKNGNLKSWYSSMTDPISKKIIDDIKKVL